MPYILPPTLIKRKYFQLHTILEHQTSNSYTYKKRERLMSSIVGIMPWSSNIVGYHVRHQNNHLEVCATQVEWNRRGTHTTQTRAMSQGRHRWSWTSLRVKKDLGERKFKGNQSRVCQIRLANSGTCCKFWLCITTGTNDNNHGFLCTLCESCGKYVKPVQIVWDDVNMGESWGGSDWRSRACQHDCFHYEEEWHGRWDRSFLQYIQEPTYLWIYSSQERNLEPQDPPS